MKSIDLPEVLGELLFDANLDKFSYFGVGGKADVLFIPSDADDLISFFRKKNRDIPVTVIGAGSNLLIRDGGVRGVVIKLGTWFDRLFVNGDIIEAGAANALPKVANKAADSGISGLEFMAGIPGTIGGGILMNAGCFDSSFKDVFIEAEAIDYNGVVHWLTKDKVSFMYRATSIKDLIVTRVWLRGEKADSATVAKNMHALLQKRKGSQQVMYRSCGSVFKNPEGHKAWQLIDHAGCRGMKIGGAMVSDIHCNFIVNTGDATATEIEDLGEEVRRRVHNDSGVMLEWEIVRIGERPV